MSDYKPLDGTADVLPVGLQPTPFGEVWQALQQVAASVWNVDPSVYRAGMAWRWYAVNHPGDLASDSLRALLVAALISEQAPMVKDWQTNAELVEYLRVWRTYSPTYAKLEAIFATFGARVEVRPISDAESQGVVPVADRRLAFYLRVEDFDAERPLTLDEVYQIAVRATPLGSRPVPYFALVGSSDVFAGPASAGLVRALWASEPAEPVIPPTPAYTEITLYIQSGDKSIQTQITSGFTGNVNSSYVYLLYEDENLTIPWSGYDYSNDYQVGYIGSLDGEWHRRLDNISDLPDTTVSTGVELAFVLLDTGAIWLCSNSAYSSASSPVSGVVVLRIYPKEQQYYAFYLGASNAYGNSNVSNNNTSGLKGFPGGSSAQTVPWDVQDATLPTRTIQKLLGSAGNEISQTGVDWRDPSLGYKFYQIANASGASISLRTVVFTLSKPTLYGWLNSDKTDKSHGTNMISFIYDESGNAVQYDPAFTYRVIGIFKSNGDAATNSWASVSGEILEQESGTNNLQIRRNYSGTLTISKVWYLKEVINPIETTFGASVTIPAGYHVESVKCSRGYAFASSVTNSGTVVDYELPGEKVYFDDTNTGLIGVKVRPALQITVINTLSHTVVATLSNKYGDTAASPETASASYVNSGGFFVKGTAKYSNSLKSSNVANAMQQFPVYFNLADSSGNWLYFCFNVPQTLWQFQNGVFSWLGDTTDASDLAYWYNTRAVQINLRPITT